MPAAFVRAHLDFMLSGPLADRVRFGAHVTGALYDHDADVVQDSLGEDVRVDARVLRVRRGTLPGLRELDTVTVEPQDGDPWRAKVRRILPEVDGIMERLVVIPA
jgi:hypothetical protein